MKRFVGNTRLNRRRVEGYGVSIDEANVIAETSLEDEEGPMAR